MDNISSERKNKHLNMYERNKIEVLRKAGHSVSEISFLLGRSVSTIYREIIRGSVEFRNILWQPYAAYSSYHGDIVYKENRKRSGRKISLDASKSELLEYIQSKLDNYFSPDAIYGKLYIDNLYPKLHICTKTIYNYIDRGLLSYPEYKKRKSKQCLPLRVSYHNSKCRSIEERPFGFYDREIGNWELDTVVGKKGTSAALLVFTERASRMELIFKMKSKTQDEVIKIFDRLERKYKDKFKNVFKTVTVDNGAEFLNTEKMESSVYNKNNKRTVIYYAHPFASWERGSNENNNKLIRKFIKKKSDIGKFSNKEIENIRGWINKYPRKLFKYKAAKDIFNDLTG